MRFIHLSDFPRKQRTVLAFFTLVFGAASIGAEQPDTSDRFYEAIRANDLVLLRGLANSTTVNARDEHGTTPLMYAAILGSLDSMKLLLSKGAEVNAKNDFDATALIWGAANLEKARLLLDGGADVNAFSKMGRTALMSAAYRNGGSETVMLLLERGAHASAVDKGGSTPLAIAAGADDIASVRLLLAHGANPNTRDGGGFTPLFLASMNGNEQMTRLFLQLGLNANAVSERVLEVVKNGPFSNGLLQPLHESAAYGGAATVRALLQFGANANARELRGMTPLISAVSTDRPDYETIRLLLQGGADPRGKSKNGENAIDWARKFRNPEVLSLLGVSNANLPQPAIGSGGDRNIRKSVEKSISLLQRTNVSFFRNGGCASCHAQNLTGMAVRAAREQGLAVDTTLDAEAARDVLALREPEAQGMLQLMDPRGGQDVVTYALFQLAAANTAPQRFADAAVHYLLSSQRSDGRWAELGDPRPPIEDGDFPSTAMGLRCLDLYRIPARKIEIDLAIAQAAEWLRKAEPRSTSDRIFQLLGLHWAGISTDKKQLGNLLRLQRSDGGWAQTPYLESDAYATGQVLYTLHELAVPANSASYQRAATYLLSTQRADGSWHVRSRAPAIQPYFESGFPHGNDQWISSAGTAWATMGLAYGIPSAEDVKR